MTQTVVSDAHTPDIILFIENAAAEEQSKVIT